MSEHEIKQKIIGWAVNTDVKNTDINTVSILEDIDPRRVRIERREDGGWNAVVRKCTFNTSSGVKKLYFAIGFNTVEGIRNGIPIFIERPLEFFLPAGQTDNDQEWITALMRSISLAARGGYVAKNLMDLRKIVSSNVIWYGQYPNGKTRIHQSLVSALAWAMQDELHKRGFLDENYEESSLDVLIERYQQITTPITSPLITLKNMNADIKKETSESSTLQKPIIGICPQPGCSGNLILLDGCPTCEQCSYSKCS